MNAERRLALRFAACALVCAAPTSALADGDDPYAYDLRFGLFPATFQAGVSQSHFGSALRAEADLARGFGVEAVGRVPWLNVLGEKDTRTFAVRAGLLWHIFDDREPTRLAGTVYPRDAGKMRGGGASGTDTDLDVPTSQKLGGPRLTLPEHDEDAVAEVRNVQTVRAGWEFARAVQRARPGAPDVELHMVNQLHAFYVGYGWGSHWNLSPAAVGGQREIGWRRFYVDFALAPRALVDADAIEIAPPTEQSFFGLGARLGMAGAICALVRGVRGLGFAYSFELGALPGESGLEGYLFLGLGLEVDATTRRRHR